MGSVRRLTPEEQARLNDRGGHGGRFTPTEDVVIRHFFATRPLADLAAAMGRTEASIRRRASLLGVTTSRLTPAPRAKRAWTTDDDDEIREFYGRLSVKALATRLGRSETAVRVRAKRLGVNAATNVWTARQIARLFGVDEHKVIQDWIAPGLLPAHRAPVRFGKHRLWRIDYEPLERFIRQHPAEYDWRRMEAGYWRTLAEQVARERRLIRLDEAARRVGISYEGLRRYVYAGQLPAVRGMGLNRPYYVSEHDLATWRPARPELIGHRGRGWRERQRSA